MNEVAVLIDDIPVVDMILKVQSIVCDGGRLGGSLLVLLLMLLCAPLPFSSGLPIVFSGFR